MKFLIILTALIIGNISTAMSNEHSRILPIFLKALENVSDGVHDDSDPNVKRLIDSLNSEGVNPDYLQKLSVKVSSLTNQQLYNILTFKSIELREDVYRRDFTISLSDLQKTVLPLKRGAKSIALHLSQIDVVNPDDDFLKDDLYCYYLVTDGTVPTGKVTSVYKGLSGGESVLLGIEDRVVYPIATEITSAVPNGHLIVDYGIVESDGDNIAEMRKLSKIIMDLAIVVYGVKNPAGAAVVNQLRKEVTALTDFLIGLNKDDRLAVGTQVFTSTDINLALQNSSFYDFTKIFSGVHNGTGWHYRLKFRLLESLNLNR